MLKTNLHLLFLHDVVIYCCIFYNMILDKKDFDINTLMNFELRLQNFVKFLHQTRKGQKDIVIQSKQLAMKLNQNCKVLKFQEQASKVFCNNLETSCGKDIDPLLNFNILVFNIKVQLIGKFFKCVHYFVFTFNPIAQTC